MAQATTRITIIARVSVFDGRSGDFTALRDQLEAGQGRVGFSGDPRDVRSYHSV